MNVGDYRLIANLGRGGMADVFLAARLGPASFTKLVVMKRLRADLVEPQYQTLMLDEARLAARLHHANIVQTNEVGDRDGLPYLIMEYLEGCSVAQVMRAARRAGVRIEVPYVVRIVKDVLAALIYAHGLTDYNGRALHVVHRDVSPQNIFWMYDGHIKLMDFGIAKYALSSMQTEIGMIKGKLPYMPPEQARGERVDDRADVYGLGVVMWELLAGQRLFRAPTAAAELHNVLYMPVPSLADIVDPDLAAICARALERARDARFDSAAAMLAAIDAVDAPTATHEELSELVRSLCCEQRTAIAQQIRAALAGEGLADPEGADVTTYAKSAAHRPVEPTAQTPSVREPRPAVSAPETQVPRRRFVGASLLGLVLVAGAAGAAGAWLRNDDARPVVARPQPAAIQATAPAPAPLHATLRLCGSNTIGSELAPALVEAYLAKKGATKIARLGTEDAEHTIVVGTLAGHELSVDVIARGSATAFDGLAARTCDIGMASRAINDGDVAKLAGIGNLRSPATEHVIALDGIAVIVNPNNPLRTLDRAALHDIFIGKTTDWSTIGGGAGPIHVLARDDKSGTYDTFKNLVLAGDKLVAGAQRFSSSEQLADAVATDPAAIGFIGLAYIRSAKAIAVGDAGVQAMMPTSFTVTTEDYLLARRLYFYTPPSPSTPLVAELVSFAMSAQGQEVVRDHGFVDLSVGLHPGTACDLHCPAAYASATHHAKRLSLDFRFREGSDEIDSRATRDLDRLTQTLRAYPDATLVLFGFSDSNGDPAVNLALSRQRAKAIADELATRGITSVAIDGFGPALPVASNATAAGRQRNRRVEVWLR